MHEQTYPEFPGASYDAWKTRSPPEYDEPAEEHACAEEACPDCGMCLWCGEGAHQSWCGEPDRIVDEDDAGYEPAQPASAEWHFGVDAELLDTIEDGPAGPDCPCARCGAQFRSDAVLR